MTYRTGNHWGVTIVREGLDVAGETAELVAVVVNGDQALAERMCALLNGEVATGSYAARWAAEYLGADPDKRGPAYDAMPDSCTCPLPFGVNPACPVHQGRRARGPKPPNPPGCICDGSGRTCPRHGAVI